MVTTVVELEVVGVVMVAAVASQVQQISAFWHRIKQMTVREAIMAKVGGVPALSTHVVVVETLN